MATTSGTVNQTVVLVDDILTTAMRRAGKLASRLTPETISEIKLALYLMLLEVSNKGVNLWAVVRTLVGVYPGQSEYQLPAGTIDVLNAYFRLMNATYPSGGITSSAGGSTANLIDQNTSTVCTQVSTNGSYILNFGSATQINVLGMLPAFTGAFAPVVESSPDGVSWTTIATLGALSATSGQWNWLQLDPSPMQQYMRLRETGGATLSLAELFPCQLYSDIPISRTSRDDYSSLPFKQFGSQQPYQYWLNRQISPSIVIYPEPQSTFNAMYLYTNRYIQDVGALTNLLEVPVRWLPAIIWGLAEHIMLEIPLSAGEQLDQIRLNEVKGHASRTLVEAKGEERDKAPINLMPRIGVYTR